MATANANSNREYAVFLSYRHSDNKEQGRQWATWLHQVLESYEIPADLIGSKNNQDETVPASLYPVFRDEEELPADADLTRKSFTVGIGIFTLYGIFLIVMLMLADVRTWARHVEPGAVTPSGTVIPTSSPPASGLAIGSLVASVIPFLLLGQITGLILGIIALRKIRQSQGAVGGKGFAIAGVTISGLILLFIIGVLVLLIVTGAFKK